MNMNPGLSLLSGIGLGAGLMYFLDPVMGRRRRALLGDQATAAWRDLQDATRVTARDLSQRSQGLLAEGRAHFSADAADDHIVAGRVRSALGRWVSHPRAVVVQVRDGRAILSGLILRDEVERLLARVASVRGVRAVENHLEVHERSENLPALQGGRPRTGERFALAQARWSPTTRLLVGGAGAALVAYGMTERFPVACILGTIGLGLMGTAGMEPGARRMLEGWTAPSGHGGTSRGAAPAPGRAPARATAPAITLSPRGKLAPLG
jgi:hypothetical protein